MEWLFWTIVICVGLWMAYMATFRTDQWVSLCEMGQRRKQARREGAARIGGAILRAFFGR